MAKQNKRLTKVQQDKFRRALKTADTEKGIEKAYQDLISMAFQDLVDEGYAWSTAHQTDGIFAPTSQQENLFGQYENQPPGLYSNFEILRLLLETKFDQNLMEQRVQCKTILQALFYLKRIKDDNEELPNVILVGDCNECFVVAESALHKYLQKQGYIDWSVAPSTASEVPANQKLLLELIGDTGITPFVFKICKSSVDLNEVINLIADIANRTELIKLKIDEKNVRLAYDSFINSVFRFNTQKLSPVKLVAIFIQTLTDPRRNYLLPYDQNILHLDTTSAKGNSYEEIQVVGRSFLAFFSRFSRSFTPEEINHLKSIADRLIEETTRRQKGDFWTPSRWALEGNKTLDEVLGKDWRDEYVVWDCCCGSKNLTRDHTFLRLYCSTIHQQELDISRDYNTNAIATFQMDFLNDDMEVSPAIDPKSLKKIPPPYTPIYALASLSCSFAIPLLAQQTQQEHAGNRRQI